MANAWCINAYNCDGGLIQTLQTLDSACIGVGVQYTAPNPLDDKRLDYIKYTDKCWCVCCLSWENEILIYATDWVIKNLTLTNDDVNEAIKIQWNDIFWSNRAKTIVRYKTGSAPVSITDGTLAVEETTKNQYSSTPFSLTGVLDETTYYFTAFALDSNDNVISSQISSVTTDFQIVVEVDFTTWMHDFTYLWSSRNNVAIQGRDNTNWLYITYNNTSNIQWYFSIPSSIYTQWNIKKIEFETYSNIQQTWPMFNDNSISNWKDQPKTYFRVRYASIAICLNWSESYIDVWNLPSWQYTTIFDFDNQEAYISTQPNNKISIPNNYISRYKEMFSNWNMVVALAKWWNSWTVYLRKIKFYMK